MAIKATLCIHLLLCTQYVVVCSTDPFTVCGSLSCMVDCLFKIKCDLGRASGPQPRPSPSGPVWWPRPPGNVPVLLMASPPLSPSEESLLLSFSCLTVWKCHFFLWCALLFLFSVIEPLSMLFSFQHAHSTWPLLLIHIFAPACRCKMAKFTTAKAWPSGLLLLSLWTCPIACICWASLDAISMDTLMLIAFSRVKSLSVSKFLWAASLNIERFSGLVEYPPWDWETGVSKWYTLPLYLALSIYGLELGG